MTFGRTESVKRCRVVMNWKDRLCADLLPEQLKAPPPQECGGPTVGGSPYCHFHKAEHERVRELWRMPL